MVKRAIVSDIHANLEALEAVLNDLEEQGAEEILCLGDIVGYGPNPRECVDRAIEFDVCVLGNHDSGALFDPEGFSSGAERAIFWTRSQLEDPDDSANPRRWQFLCGIPRTCRRDGLLLVHGSARSPLTEYVFPDDIYNARKLQRIFQLFEGCCLQGHTHVPGVFTIEGRFHRPEELPEETYINTGKKVMINVGSVGQPRDGDRRACYLLQDGERLMFRRVPYAAETTRRKIHEIPELDDYLGDRLLVGK